VAETHVVAALKEKRARLPGELEACKLRVTALTVELGSVDNCLRIFRSDVDPKSIAPKVTLAKSALPKGAGARTALDILRKTGRPMTCPELAACILQRFGKPLTVKALHQLVATIHGNFSCRKDGIVTFNGGTYLGKGRLNIK
jgi:hypothetical protein